MCYMAQGQNNFNAIHCINFVPQKFVTYINFRKSWFVLGRHTANSVSYSAIYKLQSVGFQGLLLAARESGLLAGWVKQVTGIITREGAASSVSAL